MLGAEIAHRDGRRAIVIADALAVVGRLEPAIGLTAHLGGKPRWRDEIAAFVPANCPRA